MRSLFNVILCLALLCYATGCAVPYYDPCEDTRYLSLKGRADSLSLQEKVEYDSLASLCTEAILQNETKNQGVLALGVVLIVVILVAIVFSGTPLVH